MSGSDSQLQIEQNLAALDRSQYVKEYYVDIDAGISGAAGVHRSASMAEVSEAITAWETYRLTLSNPYSRAVIYIYGGESAYAELSALPSYCDMVGIGADPRGNGVGVARIGADSGAGENGVVAVATVRGLNIKNIQFQAGNNGYAFKGTNFFRCMWENVVFATNGDPINTPAAGFQAAICSGNVWRNCQWMTASGVGSDNDIGFKITGTHFHNCLVEYCHITGRDVGVEIAAGCINGFGSRFYKNHIGWGSATCLIGVDDNATVGHIMYEGNFIAASSDGELVHNGSLRWIANYVANGFSAVTAS